MSKKDKLLKATDLTDAQLQTAATSPISTKKMREDAEAEQKRRYPDE